MGMTRSLTSNGKIKNRRGRPKMQREKIDRGTVELQAKKRILAGAGGALGAGDVSQTLSLLYYRKALTAAHFKAGKAYIRLWQEVGFFWGFSPLNRSCLVRLGQGRASYSPWDQPHQTPEHKEYIRWRWTQLQRLLVQESVQTQRLVYRVLVENYITPGMIQEDVSAPLELILLQKGLDIVYRFFENNASFFGADPCPQEAV